ncbi:TetR family transcriptional regulator [Nitrospirillum amazonense]|uniref:TetR family transcriptional regulator n=1 Tax=Nitrospirillum amazonense TaxID=28077 RepID=A0A560FG91_9PROT|nr:TetR/AcrR family transcriptional regulator [Nitrospirillum amazonense]TWB20608.1 TetR family transcriptional regulator [Nitrospirillum amazonense]
MPRLSDAKKHFVDTAVTLFRRKGYNGVGLNEIIAVSGAPKGSFYHHFPGGKEELAEEAARLAGHRIARLIDQAFTDAPTFADGVHALADTIADWFEASDWRDGCPVTALVIGAIPDSTRLSAVVAEVLEDWAVRTAGHAERLGVGDPRERAARFFIALEGAWLLARVQRTRAPFKLAAAMVL